MDNIKCSQCGASLAKDKNVCEYCGSVNKVSIETTQNTEQTELKEKAENQMESMEELLNDIFNFPFIKK